MINEPRKYSRGAMFVYMLIVNEMLGFFPSSSSRTHTHRSV